MGTRAPSRRASIRVVPAAVCVVLVAAAGFGLLVPTGSGDSLPAARVRADVRVLERAPAGSRPATDALHDLARMPTTSRRPLDLVGMALVAAAGTVCVLLLASRRRTRVLERHSSRDALTDLANRRQLERDVSAHATDQIAVLMIDIDHFKILNDTGGHPVGDQALVQVADCIARSLRPGDLVYRYGGEEFCALLPDADLDAATAVAERVRASVELLDVGGADQLPGGRLTVSVGVAIGPPEPGIGAADRALYAAKASGRNRVSTTPEPVNR